MSIQRFRNLTCRPSRRNCRDVLLSVLTAGALLLSTALDAGAMSHTPDTLVGSWQGSLAVGSQQLRLVFKVHESSTESSHAALEATLDSPDQAATDIPIAKVELSGDTVRFEIGVLGAVFEGSLTEDGNAIDGEWRQSGQTLPLRVEREVATSSQASSELNRKVLKTSSSRRHLRYSQRARSHPTGSP